VRVRLSPAALRDLDQAKRWLRQPGAGDAAKKKLRKIRAAILQLGETPWRWPVGDHPGVRDVPVEGYRIMYEIHPDIEDDAAASEVRVLRVFGPHMTRDIL